MKLRVTKSQLKRIINEEVVSLRESSEELRSINRINVFDAIRSLRKRLSNVEASIDLMGGAIVDYNQDIEDLKNANQERPADRSRDLASVEDE